MSGSKTTANNTEKVTLPAWVSQGGEQNFANAQNFAAANPIKAYTGPLAAGSNDNQNLASAIAGQTGVGARDLNAARGYASAATSGAAPMIQTGPTAVATQGPGQAVGADRVSVGQFDQSAVDRYRNPYIANVQNSTLDSMRRQDAMDQNGLADQTQAAGAFGGARATLAATELNRNQATGRQSYLNQSNADAFGNAQQQFERDRAAQFGADTANQNAGLNAGQFNSAQAAQIAAANAGAANTAAQADASRALSADSQNQGNVNSLFDRLLQASQQRSQIAGQAQDFTSNDIANLLRTGATQQNTEQGQIQAAYADKQLNDNASMQRFQQLASLLGMTPTDKTATSNGTTTQSGGLLNSLLAAGQVGLSAYSTFSDRRVKRDIVPLGGEIGGVPAYAYRYLWSDEIHVGVMADEVARLRPEALGPVLDGMATVDYGRLSA